MVVFVGGYFYDPFFGPYPWWPRAAYRHLYYPIYDHRAVVRVIATPKDAAVYVDGFYAGTVHDFNDWFQGLPLPPGGHEIVLYFEGYRTVRHSIYLSAGSAFKLRHTMERLPAGELSDPPAVAPPVPPPPAGTYLPPRSERAMPRSVPAPEHATLPAQGTLSIRIQPIDAEVWIDGERWASSDSGRFMLQLPAGPHRLEVARSGYRTYSTDVELREGQSVALNVTLTPEQPRER
jgi:hypothetical protein